MKEETIVYHYDYEAIRLCIKGYYNILIKNADDYDHQVKCMKNADRLLNVINILMEIHNEP